MTNRPDDDHLAAVIRATQLEAGRRRDRRRDQSGRLRLRLARRLVRTGLRLAEPATSESLLATFADPPGWPATVKTGVTRIGRR